MSKTNLTYSEHTQKKRLVTAKDANANANANATKKTSVVWKRAIELQNLFFFYLLRCITLLLFLTHEGQFRRPTPPSYTITTTTTTTLSPSSSSKHAPCCGRFPVALTRWRLLSRLRLKKTASFVSVRTRTGRSACFFLSLSYVSKSRLWWWWWCFLRRLFHHLRRRRSRFFRDFSALLRFRGRFCIVSSTRPLRIASSARTANLWNVFEFANASTRNSFRTHCEAAHERH